MKVVARIIRETFPRLCWRSDDQKSEGGFGPGIYFYPLS